MELKAIDYTLIIITLLGVIFLAYRFMIYLGEVRSAPGYAKRKVIGYLFLAFISLTGIIPLFRDSVMNALGLEMPEYFTEYSFGAFAVLAIAAVLILRSDKKSISNTEVKQSNQNGDNVAGDKIQGDKVDGDKIGGDKIDKKKVEGDEVKGDKIVNINPTPRVNDPKKLTFIQKINPDELVGRKNDLEKLHQLLTEKKKVVVVNGMGGIGKTTLAAAYTFQFEAYYQKIVWITQSQEDISNDFIQNQQLINSLNIDTEGKQADLLFAEILHALINIPEKPKLLVVDNAFESLETHLSKLPSQPEWDLLVTSREAIEGLHPMPLDFLKEEEAIALFQKYCSRISDAEAIRELVNTVELHTLTIEILARTAEKQRNSTEELKEALEKDLKSNVKTAHSKKNQIERITSYLGTIFDFSILNEDEIWLLKNFCALPSQFHSYSLLINITSPEVTNRKEVFAETLEQLERKGWLLSQNKKNEYKMHRIVGQTTLLNVDLFLADIQGITQTLKGLLALDGTKDNPIRKFQWIPYGLKLLDCIKEDENELLNDVKQNLAMRLRDSGEFQVASQLLKSVVRFNEAQLGLQHNKTAKSYSDLGLVSLDIGDSSIAKEFLEKALRLAERNFGKNHRITAVRYSNYSSVLINLGEYDLAQEYLEKALAFDRNKFENNPAAVAVRYNNLAQILSMKGENKKAKGFIEMAIEFNERHFGTNHPSTITNYSVFAGILHKLGMYKVAKKHMERVVSYNEITFGKTSAITANSYSNLAAIIASLGEKVRARNLVNQSILSLENQFNIDHINLATHYSNSAAICYNMGNLAEAIRLQQKSLKLFESHYGRNHPETAHAYNNLAIGFTNLGLLEQAQEFNSIALASLTKSLAVEHPYLQEANTTQKNIREALKGRK